MTSPEVNNPLAASYSRRKFLSTASALMTATALSTSTWTRAFAASPALTGRDPKTLVVVVDAAVNNLDPATNTSWAYGLQPVYDSLTRVAGLSTTETTPWLAESFQPNDDHTVWTCKLHHDVTFHDGTICDAAAVKAAILRTATLPTGQGYVWSFTDPDKQMEVVDALTLRFNFAPQARPYFDRECAGQYGFGIASVAAAKAHSKSADDQGSEWLQSHPVGTGPYLMESLDPDHEVIYRKNPTFWGGWQGDHFDRVITKTVPLSATRRQLLERGEADIIWPGTPEDTVALEKDPRFVVTDAKTMTMEFIFLGNYGPLKDPRARQAINHAFDTDAYIRQVTLGTQDMPQGVFPSLMATAAPVTNKIPFDLAKARELFDAAGVAQGTELTFEYFEGFGDTAGQLLQSWLGQIGIKLKLVEKSFSAFIEGYFSDAPAETRPNMYFFSWWPQWNHPYSFAWTLFHKDAWGSKGGNAGLYSNDEANKLIASMYQAKIDDDLAQKSKRLQEILTSEDPAWIPIAEERTRLVCRTDIKGLQLNPIYVLTLDMYALSRGG